MIELEMLIDYISQIGSNLGYVTDAEAASNVARLPHDVQFTNIYWEINDLLFSITFPHQNNDYQYILRICPKKTFDRWSNAEIEVYYSDLDVSSLHLDLEYPMWIYRELFHYYLDLYLDLCE